MRYMVILLLLLSGCAATPYEDTISYQMRKQIRGWGDEPYSRTDVHVRPVPWENRWIKKYERKDP